MADAPKPEDGLVAALMATGHFQDHPDGSLATDMDIRHAKGLASAMMGPSRPCVIRCPDGVLLLTPPRAGSRADHLKARGWDVDAQPGGTIVAWKKSKPAKPGDWDAATAAARDELMARVSSVPPHGILGVVARHGGGGIDEIGLVLGPASDARAEAQALAGGDIEAEGRTFLVDAFRGGVPNGFDAVPSKSD